jgi:hypothetical protein
MPLYEGMNLQAVLIQEKSRRTVHPAKRRAMEVVRLLLIISV